MAISNKRRLFEIIAAFFTGLGKFLFFDLLGVQFWYILLVGLFWLAYVIYRIKEDKGILA